MRILLITSVAAERDAVFRGLNGAPSFKVVISGVGTAAAAANTAAALAVGNYDMVINVGIAGGFVNKADMGFLVVADQIIAADLGAETPKGFCSLDKLGFGFSHVSIDSAWATKVVDALRMAKLPVTSGPILSVSTVTGTSTTALELSSRVPGATAEAMEGFGVATAAQMYGLPVLEIRAISNLVGPRDRDSWKIEDALLILERASSVLVEVLS